MRQTDILEDWYGINTSVPLTRLRCRLSRHDPDATTFLRIKAVGPTWTLTYEVLPAVEG
jgi:hypothetical protein